MTEIEDARWVKDFRRRRLRTLVPAVIAMAALVLGFVAKQRFERWSWFVAIGMGAVILSLLGVYVRWIGSDAYCRGLPAARRYAADARFYRCVLIGLEVSDGWSDRSGVVVLTRSGVELCDRWSDLRLRCSLATSDVQMATIVRRRFSSTGFVELDVGSGTCCLRASARTIKAIVHHLQGSA